MDKKQFSAMLDAELKSVKDALTRAKTRCGITVPIVVVPEIDIPSPLGVGQRSDGTIGLAYRIGIGRRMSESQIEAAIAHELGHIAHGDLERKPNAHDESEADNFAVAHGYGAGLLSVFDEYRHGIENDDEHPAIDDRIAAVRNAMVAYA